MSLITGIPGIVALAVCMRRGTAQAFLKVYLPVLLLLPDSFRWSITGHLTFNESAILPIAAFFFLSSWRKWEWSVMDFLVTGLVAVMIVAEYINRDYYMARSIGFNALLTVMLPYILAKGLLRRQETWTELAKVISILLAIVATVGVYELISGMNPFQELFKHFFPGQPHYRDALRFGLTRTTGPYLHAILAGLMFAASYRITRWLDWSRRWPGNVGWLPISKVHFCELSIVAGSVMTLSRGPWIATGIAALIISLCRARSRRRLLVLAGAALVSIPLYQATISYVSLSPAETTTELQRTAAYRYELIERYFFLVEQRPAWGWGLGEAPQAGDLPSIDNEYLLLALTYGIFATTLLVTIFVWMSIRLFAYGIRLPRDDPTALLALTLLGVHIVFAVSITMSWLGAQTEPMLFLMAGWSEAVLSAHSADLTVQ